ncbi:MAG TPA: hypothetical protein VMN03_07985 [Burkholderiales bacterium]|nr:hypothetical protein [Burkholderiales bacterium]
MDLLALVAHGSSSSYENQAWPRERLGTQESQPALTVLRDQFLSFGSGRSAWVSVKRRRLHALVGARPRGGRQAWEIDYLVDCDAEGAVVGELLTQAVQAAGGAGVEKLFMRIGAGTELLGPAREAGFMPYQEEALYGLNGALDAKPVECRPVTVADSYPLFRLYTASVPEAIRRHEAVTYAEWQAGMERRWLRNGVQLVVEKDGAIQGSVRASRLAQGVLLDLTLSPEAIEDATGLIAAARRAIGGDAGGPTLVLVPTSDEGLARRLDDAGFGVAGEYVSLVHRTTRPLSLPKAVPAVVENAVGV